MTNRNPIFQAESEHLEQAQQAIINELFSLLFESNIEKISSYVINNKDNLTTIYELIRKKKEVQTLPRATSLSYLAMVSDQHTLGNLIRILCAICYVSMEKNLVKDFQHVIKKSFHSCRILATKESYLSLLNEIQCSDLSLIEMVTYFSQLNENCKKDETTGKHLIYDIHHLLSLYRSEKKPRSKPKTNIEPDGKIERSVTKSSLVALDSDECKTKSFQSETVINSNVVEPTEYGSDSRTATVYHEVDLSDTKYVSSLHLQQKQARKVAQHMYKREKQLACDYRILTEHELHNFVEYYLKNANDEYTAVIFTVLCTGRSIDELQKAAKKSHSFTKSIDRESIGWDVELPIHSILDEIKGLLMESSSTLSIKIPLRAYNVSNIVWNDASYLESQCNERLKQINHSLKTRFTIQRLQNAFSAYMHHHHIDSAEIAYLLGREIRQTASCFYHQTSVGQLIKIYQDWLHYLFAKQNKSVEELKDNDTTRFGSHLVIRKANIKELFSIFRTELAEPITQLASIEESHNRYVCFLILMLNLATGHRAVRHPYCYRNDFDLLTNRLFISDKEGRGSLSARILPLPSIVSPYLKEYNEHLAQVLAIESPYSSETSKCIIGAMESSKPYFFFLNNHQYVPVTPLTLSENLENILPLPLNWNRHFIRGYLLYHGIHTHVIDAFMGHSSNAGEPFAKYSALGTYDLKPIAKQLNKLLVNDLGFGYDGLWGSDVSD